MSLPGLPGVKESMSDDEKLSIILDQTLEMATESDPAVAAALLYCAVPHWFTAELIGRMRSVGPTTDLSDEGILEKLQSYAFTRKHPVRGYAYHESVRAILLSKLHHETPGRFLEYSQRTRDYFAKQSEIVVEGEKPEYQREAMYHLLAVNEDEGFEQFEQLFLDAERSYQLSVCGLLLDLAEEQKEHLDHYHQLSLDYYAGRLARNYADWEKAESIQAEVLERCGNFPIRWPLILLKVAAITELFNVYQVQRNMAKLRTLSRRAYSYFDRLLRPLRVLLSIATKSTLLPLVGKRIALALLPSKKAPEILRRAAEIYKVIGDGKRIFGELDEAIEVYERALEIFRKLGDDFNEATILSRLAKRVAPQLGCMVGKKRESW